MASALHAQSSATAPRPTRALATRTHRRAGPVPAIADPDAPSAAPAPSIQPIIPRAELSEGIASFYDESSGLWESMW